MDDIMKIVMSLDDTGLMIKGVCETIKDEAKEQKGGLVSMLLAIWDASLLGNLLTGKRVKRLNALTVRAKIPKMVKGLVKER